MKGRVWSNREKRYLSHDENFCLALAEYCDRSEERNIYRIVVCNPDWQSYDLVQDDDLIFELSSGLEDKNGVEICVGDIVKNIEGVNETAVCVWDESNAEFDFRGKDGKYTRDNVKSWLEMYEVIGNIHENPELLEEKE